MVSGLGMTLVYDSANRLTSAGGNSYTYDVENIRARNLCGGKETEYTYNTNAGLTQLLYTVDEDGNTVKYIYGMGLIGEVGGDGAKVYHFDYRGSTAAVTDKDGNITDTFTYDTYGKLTERTGTSEIIFLYNGRDGVITDQNGLLYMRARYYSPDLKRFVNMDIIAGEVTDPVTLNRYAYANGNPVSNIDPFGLSAERGNKTTASDIWNNIKNFAKDFIDTSVKGIKTIFVVLGGFELQLGYGTGLRGAIDVAGESIVIGSKVDLITIKIGSDYFDVGQEALAGAEWNLSFDENIGIGLETGYFESYITGQIEHYDENNPEINFSIVGIDLYLIQGVNAEISYDFKKVYDKIISIWK